jgi:hypothetical protein
MSINSIKDRFEKSSNPIEDYNLIDDALAHYYFAREDGNDEEANRAFELHIQMVELFPTRWDITLKEFENI